MEQQYPMEPYEQAESAVVDYRQQAREFLVKSREYLDSGDLHQASEKGWGAAAWMAKAVADTQGWQYSKHDQFFSVMRQARVLSGDARLRNLGNTANTLHGYFYTRKRFLDPDEIAEGLNDVELLLDVMQPLTEES
jgi:uncharacterized protein (UPF0332 family)